MNIQTPFQVVKTVNPNERAFISRHDQESFSNLRPDEFPRSLETLYSDFRFKEPARVKLGWGNYIYTEGMDPGNAELAFLWVKVKTDEEIATPFETQEVTGRHGWLPVLEWVDFGQERGFPLSQAGINSSGQQATFQAPRWQVRYAYRPDITIMTRMSIRLFLSHKPFSEYEMESDEPIPSEVSWDLVSSHGSMGSCLHPEVEVPANSAGFVSISTAGSLESSSSTAASGQFFPKTNHKGWRDYVVNDVKYVNGQYLRTEITYRAPLRTKLTQKAS